MVGDFFFFLISFSYSGLRAFFTSDFTNCTTDYAPPHKLPQPSGAVHSIWWLGFFFFDLFSYSGLRAFFTSDFTNCTTDYAPLPQINPTIRCCSQHLMVGVFFFWIVLQISPILDLEHFSQVILRIVLQIMPPIRCCSQQITPIPNHQVLFTASDGWGFFFFDLFSYSGLRAFFTSDFTNCTTDYAPQINPTIRCCSQHLMVGFFFLISSPILDLEHFSQVIYELYYRLCPPPQITPTIRCCSQHLMVGFFFFFLTFSPILDLEHFSQVILRIVLQIMPPPKLTQPSGAVHSI